MALYRKVIKIRGEDSPNVRLGLAQLRAGRIPSGEMLIPGVLPWADYVKRRETWDKVKQTIGLDAEFYEGAELLLYPADWLDRAERIAANVARQWGARRPGRGLGVDPAEGGDKTAFAVIDEHGLIELLAYPTVDTSVIVNRVISLMQEYKVPPHKVCFDRGGGGKEHADYLRAAGYQVRTVAFGESVHPEAQDGPLGRKGRLAMEENKYPYKNRRAKLYGDLRELLRPDWLVEEGEADDKTQTVRGFGIPDLFTELRRQLSLMPLRYDVNGRMYLPAKSKRSRGGSGERTLDEIIGHSPDEADALVIAIHAMRSEGRRVRAGAAW